MTIQALYELYVQQKQKISTDTRKIESDCLYFALKGDNFDGNAFAHKAIENGAFKAVIDDATYAIEGKTILVDDVLSTLQGLANHHRKQFKIPIIGIAGSNGKTTTKELIAAVLRQKYKTHATAGNFNNHIGVPLTLLYMPLDTEMAVIEMGANRPGEVEELCQIVAPNYGVVTSLGLEHIEGFGSFEMVVKTECELYDYLHEHKGMLFVNGDDAILMEKTESYKNRFVFGTGTQVDVVGKFVKANPYVEFKWETAAKQIYRAPVVSTSLIGNYNLSNLLVAASFGRFFSVDYVAINNALAKYTPSNNRSQLIPVGSNSIIMDAYNANPTSMELALHNLTYHISSEIKIAILGDMLELGHVSEDEHQKIVNWVGQSSLTKAYLVGAAFSKAQCVSSKVVFCKDVEELKQIFDLKKLNNATVLVKGSRGIKLEKILELI